MYIKQFNKDQVLKCCMLLLFILNAKKNIGQTVQDSVWFNLGQNFYQQRQFDEAVYDFSKSIASGYKIARSYGYRGSCKISTGKIDEAEADLNMAYKIDPQDGLIYFFKAQFFLFGKNNGDSLLFWSKKAFMSDSANSAYTNILALSYAGINKLDSALKYAKRSVELSPYDADCLINLGAIEKDMDKYEDALIHFKTALKIRPDDPLTSINIAYCKYKLKEPEEALQICNKVLAMYEDLTWGRYVRGLVNHAMGNKKASCEDLNRVLTINYIRKDDDLILKATKLLKEYGCSN